MLMASYHSRRMDTIAVSMHAFTHDACKVFLVQQLAVIASLPSGSRGYFSFTG